MKGCAGFKIKMACLFQDNLYMSRPQRSLMIWGKRYKREFSPFGNFDCLEVELWVSGTALKLGSHMGKKLHLWCPSRNLFSWRCIFLLLSLYRSEYYIGNSIFPGVEKSQKPPVLCVASLKVPWPLSFETAKLSGLSFLFCSWRAQTVLVLGHQTYRAWFL